MKNVLVYNSLLVFILNPVDVFSLAPESFVKEQTVKSEEYRLETTSDSLQQKRAYTHGLVEGIDRFNNRKQSWLENIRIWKSELLVGHEFPFDDDSVDQAIESLENFLSDMNEVVEGSVLEEKFANVDRAVGFYKIQMMRKLLSMVGELYGVSNDSTFTFIVNSLDSLNYLKARKVAVDVDDLERCVKTQEKNIRLFLRNAIGNTEKPDAKAVQAVVNTDFERIYNKIKIRYVHFRGFWKQANQMLQDEDSRYDGVLYQLFLIYQLSDYHYILKVQNSYQDEMKQLQNVYHRKASAYTTWRGSGSKRSTSFDGYVAGVDSLFEVLFNSLETGVSGNIWRMFDSHNREKVDEFFHKLFFNIIFRELRQWSIEEQKVFPSNELVWLTQQYKLILTEYESLSKNMQEEFPKDVLTSTLEYLEKLQETSFKENAPYAAKWETDSEVELLLWKLWQNLIHFEKQESKEFVERQNAIKTDQTSRQTTTATDGLVTLGQESTSSSGQITMPSSQEKTQERRRLGIERLQTAKQIWLRDIGASKSHLLAGHESFFDDAEVNEAMESLENFLRSIDDEVDESQIEERFSDVDRAIGFYKVKIMKKLLSMVAEFYGVSNHSSFALIDDELTKIINAKNIDLLVFKNSVAAQERAITLFLRDTIGNQRTSVAREAQSFMDVEFKELYERLEANKGDLFAVHAVDLLDVKTGWEQADKMLQREDSRYKGILQKLFLLNKMYGYSDVLDRTKKYRKELDSIYSVYQEKAKAYNTWKFQRLEDLNDLGKATLYGVELKEKMKEFDELWKVFSRGILSNYDMEKRENFDENVNRNFFQSVYVEFRRWSIEMQQVFPADEMEWLLRAYDLHLNNWRLGNRTKNVSPDDSLLMQKKRKLEEIQKAFPSKKSQYADKWSDDFAVEHLLMTLWEDLGLVNTVMKPLALASRHNVEDKDFSIVGVAVQQKGWYARQQAYWQGLAEKRRHTDNVKQLEKETKKIRKLLQQKKVASAYTPNLSALRSELQKLIGVKSFDNFVRSLVIPKVAVEYVDQLSPELEKTKQHGIFPLMRVVGVKSPRIAIVKDIDQLLSPHEIDKLLQREMLYLAFYNALTFSVSDEELRKSTAEVFSWIGFRNIIWEVPFLSKKKEKSAFRNMLYKLIGYVRAVGGDEALVTFLDTFANPREVDIPRFDTMVITDPRYIDVLGDFKRDLPSEVRMTLSPDSITLLRESA